MTPEETLFEMRCYAILADIQCLGSLEKHGPYDKGDPKWHLLQIHLMLKGKDRMLRENEK